MAPKSVLQSHYKAETTDYVMFSGSFCIVSFETEVKIRKFGYYFELKVYIQSKL